MKIDCKVMNDLYILYMENELSSEVKAAVEEHLKQCDDCSKLYHEGKGFIDSAHDEIKIDDDKVMYPSKIDDNIKMKIKLKRLSVALVIVIISLVAFVFGNYKENRQNVLIEIESIHHNLWQIRNSMDYIKNDDPELEINPFERLDRLQEQHNVLRNQLNFIEKRRLEKTENGLFVNFELNKTMNLLHDKYILDSWTNTEEEVYSRLNKYMKDITLKLESTLDNLRGANASYLDLGYLFKSMDIDYLSNQYQKINELVTCYTELRKLPEEVELLDTEKIEEQIKKQLSRDDITLKINEWEKKNVKSTNLSYNGEVSIGKSENVNQIRVTVDAVTGRLNTITVSDFIKQGDLKPEKEVREKLGVFFRTLFSNSFEYSIEYYGENYNYHSNIDWHKVYSYNVKSFYKGYEIDMNAAENIYNFNAYTGQIHAFHIAFPMDRDMGEPVIKINPEQSKEYLGRQLNYNESLEDFEFIKTIYGYSRITNKYELKHVFQNKETKRHIFINASAYPGFVE